MTGRKFSWRGFEWEATSVGTRYSSGKIISVSENISSQDKELQSALPWRVGGVYRIPTSILAACGLDVEFERSWVTGVQDDRTNRSFGFK